MAAPSKEVRYRWTERDRQIANMPLEQTVAEIGKDPPTVTPYGIHPREPRKMLDIRSKALRSITELGDGDEVMVPLAYSAAGLENRATRFFRKGYQWEKLPVDASGKPTIGGATIGELCSALYAFDKNRFAHYDFSKRGDAWDFPRRAWKLFEYWENTDYRWAAIKSGRFSWNMDPLTISTEVTDPSDGTKTLCLLWVLGKVPEVKASSAAPSSKDVGEGNKNRNAVVLSACPDWDKDPGKPFDGLHPELLATVKRSFKARMLDTPGDVWLLDDGKRLDSETSWNLAHGWWNAERPPTNLDEALNSMSTGLINLLVRLFDRIKAIDPSFNTWRQIKYIRNGWFGGSAGYKVVYFDPVTMRKTLDSLLSNATGHKCARDKLVGSLEHQLSSSVPAYPGAQFDEWLAIDTEPPDCDTWREVDTPQEESVHFCVDKQDLKPPVRTCAWAPGSAIRHVALDDIHIDWKSPVVGIDGRTCKYDSNFLNKAEHWLQAKFGAGKPVDYFVEMYKHNNKFRERGKEAKGDLTFVADAEALDAEWESVKWALALAGKKGYEDARPYYLRAIELDRRFTSATWEPDGTKERE